MFFSKKLRYSELNSLLLEQVLVTLLEEQALSSDLLHHSRQLHWAVSQLPKPFKFRYLKGLGSSGTAKQKTYFLIWLSNIITKFVEAFWIQV